MTLCMFSVLCGWAYPMFLHSLRGFWGFLYVEYGVIFRGWGVVEILVGSV
jgi:hypothetical protein